VVFDVLPQTRVPVAISRYHIREPGIFSCLINWLVIQISNYGYVVRLMCLLVLIVRLFAKAFRVTTVLRICVSACWCIVVDRMCDPLCVFNWIGDCLALV